MCVFMCVCAFVCVFVRVCLCVRTRVCMYVWVLKRDQPDNKYIIFFADAQHHKPAEN
jgi:hypothetical protein